MNTTARSSIKWAINIIVPLLVVLIPTSELFTMQIKLFLIISIFAIILIATENLPVAATSLLLPVVYVVVLKIPTATVYSPWSLDVPWLILSGFLLTAVLERTGLLKRLAYGCILLMGGKFIGIMFGLLVLGAVISLIITDLAAKAVLIGALALSICKALNFKMGERKATFVGLSALLSVTGPSFFYLTGSTETIVPMNIAAGVGVVIPTWLEYIKHMFIPQLIYVLICAVVFALCFRSERKNMQSVEYFRAELKKLGRITGPEIKLLIVSLVLIVAIATSSYHGISVGWLFVFAVFVLFLPGLRLAQADDFKRVNFPFLLFVAACLSIGVVANYLGVGAVIAQVVYPLIHGSLIRTAVGSWLLGFLANFALTPLAAYSAFTAPVIEVASAGGLNPLPVLYTFINSLTQVALPYESAPILIIFGYGMMSIKSFSKYCIIKAAIGLVCVIVVFIPYWSLIGLA